MKTEMINIDVSLWDTEFSFWFMNRSCGYIRRRKWKFAKWLMAKWLIQDWMFCNSSVIFWQDKQDLHDSFFILSISYFLNPLLYLYLPYDLIKFPLCATCMETPQGGGATVILLKQTLLNSIIARQPALAFGSASLRGAGLRLGKLYEPEASP